MEQEITLIKESNEEKILLVKEEIEKVYPEMVGLEITPTTENQEFDGMYDKVKVNAVTNEIDSNIVAENIKQGVEILGVEGNFTGQKYKPRYLYVDVGGLFQDYTGTELDYEVANLDTSNMTKMSEWFYGATKLTHLNLSDWNTSNVTDMSYMFSNAGQYSTTFNLDISNFDTSNVTDMGSMFSRCVSLTSLDISNFDTSKVTNMGSMFSYCRNLQELDLSNFNTSKVTNMSSMFNNCKILQKLDIRNFTFESVTNYTGMFSYVPTDCLIIVKGQTEKDWVLNVKSDLTNVKTVEE